MWHEEGLGRSSVYMHIKSITALLYCTYYMKSFNHEKSNLSLPTINSVFYAISLKLVPLIENTKLYNVFTKLNLRLFLEESCCETGKCF